VPVSPPSHPNTAYVPYVRNTDLVVPEKPGVPVSPPSHPNTAYVPYVRNTDLIIPNKQPVPETPGGGQYATTHGHGGSGYGTTLGLPTPASSRTPSTWDHPQPEQPLNPDSPAPTAGPRPGQPSNWELYGKPYEVQTPPATAVPTSPYPQPGKPGDGVIVPPRGDVRPDGDATTVLPRPPVHVQPELVPARPDVVAVHPSVASSTVTANLDDKRTSSTYGKDVSTYLGSNTQQVIDVYHSQPVSSSVPVQSSVGYPSGIVSIEGQEIYGKGSSHSTTAHGSTQGSSTTTTSVTTEKGKSSQFGLSASVDLNIGADLSISHTPKPALPVVTSPSHPIPVIPILEPSRPHTVPSATTTTSVYGSLEGSFNTHVQGNIGKSSSTTTTTVSSSDSKSSTSVTKGDLGHATVIVTPGHSASAHGTSVVTTISDSKTSTSGHQDSHKVTTVVSSEGSSQQVVDVHHQGPVSTHVPIAVIVDRPAKSTSSVISVSETQSTIQQGGSTTNTHQGVVSTVNTSTTNTSTDGSVTVTKGKGHAFGFSASAGVDVDVAVTLDGHGSSHIPKPALPAVSGPSTITFQRPAPVPIQPPHLGGAVVTTIVSQEPRPSSTTVESVYTHGTSATTTHTDSKSSTSVHQGSQEVTVISSNGSTQQVTETHQHLPAPVSIPIAVVVPAKST
ncbi:hypothetical protein FRC01_012673, partial [Tulasnella sp. 417]